MTDYLLTATFERASGLAEDRIVNTFAFGNVDAGGAAQTALMAAVEAFYNTTPTNGTEYLARYLSPELSRTANASVMRLYDVTADLGGTPHGSPVAEDTWTLGAAFVGNAALPAEVACVLTIEAAGREDAAVETDDSGDPGLERDRPKMRHTGRIYFGPLNASAQDNTTPNPSRPHSSLRTLLALASNDLEGAADAVSGAGGGWCVWSRKDALMRRVSHVSVDNAWDVQRRRGVSPTVRTRTAV